MEVKTVAKDILTVLTNISRGEKIEFDEELIEEFGNNCAKVMREWLSRGEQEETKLRFSNIGQPARKLWYRVHGVEGEELDGKVMMKFMYGHLIEELALTLAQIAGHKVTHQQAEVTLDGEVKGHMDAMIDGVVVDVKSASPFGFRKFKEGTLPRDDTFGYISQVTAYETASGTSNAGFLAIDKVSGDVCFYQPPEEDKPNAHTVLLNALALYDMEEPPERCYEPEVDKLGNLKLGVGCSYCAYKYPCWSEANGGEGIRTFLYSRSPVHLVEVNRKPNVMEAYRVENC